MKRVEDSGGADVDVEVAEQQSSKKIDEKCPERSDSKLEVVSILEEK